MKKSPFRSLSAVPLALVCAALILASGARGDVPRTISYQGFLTDDVGAPLTGPVEVTFRLFAQLGGGTEAWSETHAAVQLDEGRFSVALGSVTALPLDFANPMFLEIQVGVELLAPRLPLRSVPYAIRAGTVDAGAVDTAALAPSAVTRAKLGNDLTAAGLAQNGDGSLKIALGAVDGTMLADGAVSDRHVADDADIEPTKIAGTAATLAGAETLTNKALTNPVLQVRDSDLTIIDDGDPGYTMRLQLSPPIDRTAGSRTLTMPDADGTIALESYVDAEIAGLATVASTGQYADLIGTPALPSIFGHVQVIPGGTEPIPVPIDAQTADDTLALVGVGPIVLGTSSPRAANPNVTVDLRVGDGLEVDYLNRLSAYVDDDSIGFDSYDALTVRRVTADKLYGLAAVAKSGDYTDLNGAPALAPIALSGEFTDIANLPKLAFCDGANTFTAPASALSLAPVGATSDAILLEVLEPDSRTGIRVFSVDAEGDVVAKSFSGDGSGLTTLNASYLTTGTVPVGLLPAGIPAANMDGLATIATSGEFADIANMPNFARRDTANTYIGLAEYAGAGVMLRLRPGGIQPADTVLLDVYGGLGGLTQVARIDSEGDVVAKSFSGIGAGLTALDANALASGSVSLARLPLIPSTKTSGFATIATSGEFADIANMPNFARRDTANTFTAPASALSLAPVGAAPDAILLEVLPPDDRTGVPAFSVDAEGDVIARSFSGIGAGLTALDANALVSGTVSLDRLPFIPTGKVTGLNGIATSGLFDDLSNVPKFARLDSPNIFTAPGAISLEPDSVVANTVLIQIPGPPARGPAPALFALDSEGDVTATSFTGDGSGLQDLDAGALRTGIVPLGLLPAIPAANITGLAPVATSGLFAELTGTPDFARRDQENAFTASIRAISLEPAAADEDAPILQLLGTTPGRTGLGAPVFVVDAEGDVTATSFAGHGEGLTGLNAGNIASGTLALSVLPPITSTEIQDGSIDNDDIAPAAGIEFSKLDIQDYAITNNLLENDFFDVFLGPNFMTGYRTVPSVQLGGTLDLALDTFNLSAELAGWGLMATGNTLAINLPELTPAMANDLAGKGLVHDLGDDTLAVDFGPGLMLDGDTDQLVPDVDDSTIEVDPGGKLAVKSVESVPVTLDTAEPAVPKHGSLIYKDGALQVYDDPDEAGPLPGIWIKVGTYQ